MVTAAYSSNGTDWTEQPLVAKLELPDEVTVGVFVMQTTHEVTESTFSDFTVEKVTEKK